MITADWVITRMRSLPLLGYEWAADYIAQVAEVCRPHAKALNCLPGAVASTLRQIKALAMLLSAKDVRRILLETLEFEALVMPLPDEEIEQIALPIRPQLVNNGNAAALLRELLMTKHQGDIGNIQRQRSPARILNGQTMAVAAVALEDHFHWIPAGPEPGPGRSFFPKEQADKDAPKDAFAVWLNRGGHEPDAAACMNCWEAVFFSAYKANLLTVQKLRVIHAKATLAGRNDGGPGGGEAYFSSLMNAIGFHRSAPVVAEIGLIPRAGDVVFLSRDHHVALCVDVTDEEGVDAVQVMSLWKHPRDGYIQISLAEFGPLVKEARFAPCPFL